MKVGCERGCQGEEPHEQILPQIYHKEIDKNMAQYKICFKQEFTKSHA